MFGTGFVKKKRYSQYVKLCNLVPNHMKEMDQCKLLQRELRSICYSMHFIQWK